MARAQFNQEKVLADVSNTFWRLGYHATSMQNVFEVTGLKPGSIYLAFGNKEGLFKASIDHYTEKSIAKIKTKLSQSSHVEQAIYDTLMEFIAESCTTDYCSCFLVKSQLELSNDLSLQQYIADRLQQIENVYLQFLQQHYSSQEAQIKATSLMLHIFGVRVYGYHNHAETHIINALRVGLPWLPWPEVKH